jgi:hypothetical protein
MTYLVRHPSTGVYSFRRVVPTELRTIIGKTAIKQSLRTKDVSEAKRRAHSVAAGVEAEFEKARRRLGAPPHSEMSDFEIERLAAAYLHHQLEQDETARTHGKREEDDLYKALKMQVEAAGGTALWSDEDATADVGLSNRAFEKILGCLRARSGWRAATRGSWPTMLTLSLTSMGSIWTRAPPLTGNCRLHSFALR